MRKQEDTATRGEMASLLGVSERQINALARIGVVVQRGRGRYAKEESVRGYADHLRRAASKHGDPATLESFRATRQRLAAAQAEKVEIENAVRRGELLDAHGVHAKWSNILRGVLARMLAVPGRCATRLPHLTPRDVSEIDAEIRVALNEASDGKPH
jgi:terminase small subunit / prophage DNA-packing protein